MGTGTRVASLDIVRGLIVAIMALDHTRIFFSAAQFDPLDLSQTDLAWYSMRLVTHICAPGFFFIAGFGAWLSESARLPKSELARFLVTRGVWLIALELTVMGVAWSFSFYGWFWFGVLWGLGASMVLLAGLIFLPRILLLLAALVALVLQSYWLGLVDSPIWTLLGSGGVWETPFAGQRIVLYPILPWLLLMVLGYASASWFVGDDDRPKGALLCMSGIIMLALFALARVTGFGGGGAEDSAREVMAFLSVEKYPPSLQFTLATLGTLFVFFGVVARLEKTKLPMTWLHPLNIFGRVPFFFYLLHVFLIHIAAVVTAITLGWPYQTYSFWSVPWPNLTPPEGFGFGALGVTLAWVAVLAALYPMCVWFAAVKERNKAWWLRYL